MTSGAKIKWLSASMILTKSNYPTKFSVVSNSFAGPLLRLSASMSNFSVTTLEVEIEKPFIASTEPNSSTN